MAAVFLAASETYLLFAVYGGKPLPILLPDYVIAAWLLAGSILPNWGPKLLVSGWGVALGYYYGVLAENLTFHDPPAFFIAALGVLTAISFVCLVVANRCSRSASQDSHASTWQGSPLASFLRILGVVFAVFIVTAQVLTSWGYGKPLCLLVPYYLISLGLASAYFFLKRMPELALTVWSVAVGFFYLEFTGFLVFFERSAAVLAMASVAVGASILGLVLQSAYQVGSSRNLDAPPAEQISN